MRFVKNCGSCGGEMAFSYEQIEKAGSVDGLPKKCDRCRAAADLTKATVGLGRPVGHVAPVIVVGPRQAGNGTPVQVVPAPALARNV